MRRQSSLPVSSIQYTITNDCSTALGTPHTPHPTVLPNLKIFGRTACHVIRGSPKAASGSAAALRYFLQRYAAGGQQLDTNSALFESLPFDLDFLEKGF